MAKTIEEKAKKGAFICTHCKNEFEGSECPECGNAKDNLRLAQDGIEQGLHKSTYLFNGQQLKAVDDILSDSRILEKKRAVMQMEEMDDNLREAYVLKSKIKLHDLEMQQRRKEIESKKLDEQSQEYIKGNGPAPQYSGQQQGDQSQQMPQMPNFMSSMSPQAVFMQQLMRMDSKKRAEFIEQLSDADPGALQNLSSMFSQAQPQQQNPYIQQQYGPYPMIPPWMMQQPQQQVQQAPQQNPIELVAAIFELSQKMQPPRDDSMKETLSEFKQSIQKVHDRIDTIATKERERDSSPILEKINSLEQRITNNADKKTIVDQINELTALVEGLEKAGLVKRAGSSDKTVDDELKLKEFDFKRESETRKIAIEENRLDAEKNKSTLQQSLVASLLQRGIQKGIQAREDENQSSKIRSGPPTTMNRVQTRPQAPVEVISEVQTDAGTIRETRRPVKKDPEN